MRSSYTTQEDRQRERDRIDAERYRKLRNAINYLGRIPWDLSEFIRVTAGSNKAGIDDAVDRISNIYLKQ